MIDDASDRVMAKLDAIAEMMTDLRRVIDEKTGDGQSRALERAAVQIEAQEGNEIYRKAWKAAAKLVRSLKP